MTHTTVHVPRIAFGTVSLLAALAVAAGCSIDRHPGDPSARLGAQLEEPPCNPDAAVLPAPDAGQPEDAPAPAVGACRTCEQTSCAVPLAACEAAEGVAASGPAAGQPRRALCTALVDCARASGCAETTVEDCYCGPAVDPLTCLSGGATGVCKAAFEAAAESTDGIQVAERFNDPMFASGNAVELVRCSRDSCAAACAPPPPPPPADAGAPDAELVNACRACEQMSCPAVLAACEADGLAAEGPAAGQPRRALCTALVDCARATGCAAAAIEDCYCGVGVDPLLCLSGGATGACKAAFEAAAESTDGILVAERFSDPTFASGNAVELLRCDQDLCAAACPVVASPPP